MKLLSKMFGKTALMPGKTALMYLNCLQCPWPTRCRGQPRPRLIGLDGRIIRLIGSYNESYEVIALGHIACAAADPVLRCRAAVCARAAGGPRKPKRATIASGYNSIGEKSGESHITIATEHAQQTR